MQLVRIVKIILLVLILQQILIGVRYMVQAMMLIEEKGTFGRDGTTFKTATASVFNDGKHVDVVICDNQVSTDCAEWLSPNTSTPTTYNITTTNAGFSYV